MNDTTGWPTKAEAATLIGVATKTIERLVAAGKIQQASRRSQRGGAKEVVYHPDDVDRIARERRTGPPAAFVVPDGAPPKNGNGHHAGSASAALTIGRPEGLQSVPPGDDPIRQLFAAALRAVSETSQTSHALFLTIPEAAVMSGFSQAYLRRKCQEGWSGAIKDGAWKIRRKDLEAL
jgi:hypothetical protein